jgi:hypothetical protein
MVTVFTFEAQNRQEARVAPVLMTPFFERSVLTHINQQCELARLASRLLFQAKSI